MRLVLEGTEALQGQLLRIRLQSATDDYVRGFIIQAREFNRPNRRVGTFVFAGGSNGKCDFISFLVARIETLF